MAVLYKSALYASTEINLMRWPPLPRSRSQGGYFTSEYALRYMPGPQNSSLLMGHFLPSKSFWTTDEVHSRLRMDATLQTPKGLHPTVNASYIGVCSHRTEVPFTTDSV